MKKVEKLELITKGFASKHRIAILHLLLRQRDLDLDQIAKHLGIGYKSASEHLRKMHLAGLIEKEHEGNFVLHSLTSRGKRVANLLLTLR